MLSFINGAITVLAATEGEHHENGPILPGDINEVYWGTFAFFIVASLLWWKALPAGKKMFADRRDRVVAELDEAQQARADAEAALATVRTQLSGADSERTGLIDDARQTAVAIDQEGEERAARDAEQARERALRDIASSQQQAMADLQSMVGGLTLGAAELVVRNNLDDSTHSDLIDSYIAELSAN
jgi:F-type H+-transporting ATPase subunit b